MIEIIPAIDLRGGRCVRLLRGDFDRETVYSDDPSAVAASFAAAGLTRLHVVDLDGSRSGRMTHLDVLRRVAERVDIGIDYGGGVRHKQDVIEILGAGAKMVTIGSLAITDPEMVGVWIDEFGADRFLIGIDARDGRAAVSGWTETTNTRIHTAVDTIRSLGAKYVFVTDISRDGAMIGPATDLYRELIGEFPDIEFVASGGVRSMLDIEDLDRIGCAGVIVGRALYDGTLKLEDISKECLRKE
jgi:phosphoribosylformimino-5-aminoimidazole carboxamide ribotide isomerase